MAPARSHLGRFIKSARERRGLSQAQLSFYTGVAQAEISRIETGQRQKPSADHLRKISETLDVPYEQLLIAAGYLDEGGAASLSPWDRLEVALVGLNMFSTDEIQAILDYIRFMAARKGGTPDGQPGSGNGKA